MKKNAIARMMSPKETVGSRFRKLNILPRLICLLLSMVIWLAVTNLKTSEKDDNARSATASDAAE